MTWGYERLIRKNEIRKQIRREFEHEDQKIRDLDARLPKWFIEAREKGYVALAALPFALAALAILSLAAVIIWPLAWLEKRISLERP